MDLACSFQVQHARFSLQSVCWFAKTMPIMTLAANVSIDVSFFMKVCPQVQYASIRQLTLIKLSRKRSDVDQFDVKAGNPVDENL